MICVCVCVCVWGGGLGGWGGWRGGDEGQYKEKGQKLHENYKISFLGAKQWGDMGGQTNFWGSGGDPGGLIPC